MHHYPLRPSPRIIWGMNEEHKSHDEILREIDEAKKKIELGATYVHYKGADKKYAVKEFAVIEATDELAVVYQSQYGEKLTFVRPVSVWLENVEWQGKTVPRFRKI